MLYLWNTCHPSEIMHKANFSQEEFEKCFRYVMKRDTVVLQIPTSEVFTNQYNNHLFKAWNANMDIQYILYAFSCVVYIISYIDKPKGELGLLLQQTYRPSANGQIELYNRTLMDATLNRLRIVGTSILHR